jgi:hypothetical protein
MSCRSFFRLATLAVGLVFSGEILSAAAIQSFMGGNTSTSIDSTPRTLGWYFTVSSGVTVSSLGLWDENPADDLNESHQVGIWDSLGTLLASVVVPANGTLDGSFRYSTITPLTLSTGVTYYIGALYGGNFLDTYAFGVSSLTTDSRVNFLGSAASDSNSGFAFPGTQGAGSQGRFGPNFQIGTNEIPEPSTVLLTASALVGLILVRRRR